MGERTVCWIATLIKAPIGERRTGQSPERVDACALAFDVLTDRPES